MRLNSVNSALTLSYIALALNYNVPKLDYFFTIMFSLDLRLFYMFIFFFVILSKTGYIHWLKFGKIRNYKFVKRLIGSLIYRRVSLGPAYENKGIFINGPLSG